MGRHMAGDLVGRCASLAALLEVSAYPKPGNVHRTRDFPDTKYEHFLAGSVAMGPAMSGLAVRGFDAAEGRIGWEDVEVGRLAHIDNSAIGVFKEVDAGTSGQPFYLLGDIACCHTDLL